MKNNYFLIHGSFGSPYVDWLNWLQDFIKSDEESKEVYVPQFPTGVGYQNSCEIALFCIFNFFHNFINPFILIS